MPQEMPLEAPLDIVFADDHLVVLNKPSGLLAVPGKTSNECLSLQAQAHFPDTLIAHRLDMATSGLMVMARGIAMQRKLNASFSERKVHKRYIAVVKGHCSNNTSQSLDGGALCVGKGGARNAGGGHGAERSTVQASANDSLDGAVGNSPYGATGSSEGSGLCSVSPGRCAASSFTCAKPTALTAPGDGWHTIDLPIIVDWPLRPLRKICFETGKPSTTYWRCVGYNTALDVSRLELEPVTGRSHQLRVHLQALGHPILGDTLYAPPEVAAASPRLLLHAAELAFHHPASGEWISFHSPDGFGAWA